MKVIILDSFGERVAKIDFRAEEEKDIKDILSNFLDLDTVLIRKSASINERVANIHFTRGQEEEVIKRFRGLNLEVDIRRPNF